MARDLAARSTNLKFLHCNAAIQARAPRQPVSQIRSSRDFAAWVGANFGLRLRHSALPIQQSRSRSLSALAACRTAAGWFNQIIPEGAGGRWRLGPPEF